MEFKKSLQGAHGPFLKVKMNTCAIVCTFETQQLRNPLPLSRENHTNVYNQKK